MCLVSFGYVTYLSLDFGYLWLGFVTFDQYLFRSIMLVLVMFG